MNRITSLLGIRYPIIQGGMVWCSGWRLASAVYFELKLTFTRYL